MLRSKLFDANVLNAPQNMAVDCNSHSMNRRQLIGGSAAFASAFTVGRHLSRATESYPFTLGVASGEPAQDGFVLWTRLAPTPLALDGQGGSLEPVTVMWEVAEDDAIRNVVRTGTARADRRFAHSVHAEVGGLEPGRATTGIASPRWVNEA